MRGHHAFPVAAVDSPWTPESKEFDELEQFVLSQLERFRELRNWHAHPKEFSFGPPVHGFVALEFARDVLLQLFPARNSDAAELRERRP